MLLRWTLSVRISPFYRSRQRRVKANRTNTYHGMKLSPQPPTVENIVQRVKQGDLAKTLRLSFPTGHLVLSGVVRVSYRRMGAGVEVTPLSSAGKLRCPRQMDSQRHTVCKPAYPD